MADNGGFDQGDHEQGTATSFSQMLFSDNDAVMGLDLDYQTYDNNSFSSAAHGKAPKMLCFGDYNHSDGELVVFGETPPPPPPTTTTTTTCTKNTPQKSGVTFSDSSSASSGNNSSANTPSISNKKRNGSGKESVQCSKSITATQRTSKKTKADNTSSSTGHAKARKEKLGERISVLQQLVSPFGKTDTASVLHEAMGYIRFLQEQVQVLCSPYLQHHLLNGGESGGEEGEKDLKSRGLCVVPVACTVHVANNNGADFWSPAMGNNVSPSTVTTKQQQQQQ